MLRNILNADGLVIGQLELPDDTPEETWIEKLSIYSTPPPKIIPDVTPRQIRQALILNGVSISTIDSALAALPEPQKSLATTEWEYSTMFQRHRPLVQEVAAMLSWNSDNLDALWLFAATL